jgi:hypothetical protein
MANVAQMPASGGSGGTEPSKPGCVRGLIAVLWWSALAPRLNPFDALYNWTVIGSEFHNDIGFLSIIRRHFAISTPFGNQKSF